jgi:hypothetical protein
MYMYMYILWELAKENLKINSEPNIQNVFLAVSKFWLLFEAFNGIEDSKLSP